VNNPLNRASSFASNLRKLRFKSKTASDFKEGEYSLLLAHFGSQVTGFKRGGTTFLNPVTDVYFLGKRLTGKMEASSLRGCFYPI
jgi:hypothetical protein